MQPEHDEQSSPDQDRRSTSLRPSRDTLLLLGALAFLILAVGLTFLFPLGPNGEASPTGTPLAGAATATPASPSPEPTPLDETGYPLPGQQLPTTPADVPAASTPTGETDTTGETGYPGPAGGRPTAEVPFASPEPTENDDQDAEAYPVPVGTPPLQSTPINGAPTFAPVRPTATPDVVATFPPPPAPAPTDNLGGFQQTVQPTATPEPPPDQAPTQPPPDPLPPTPVPAATPDLGKDVPPPTPVAPPAPPQPPTDVLRGNVRWRADQSPIILPRNVQLAPGAVLIIEPGVEVRLGPGVAFYVDGAQLMALGTAERPVRFVNDTGVRWEGMYGRPGSSILLEHVEMRGGGAGGTVIATEQTDMVIRRSRFNDNGGTILLTDTRLEMRDSEIAGNDMPYGAALDLTFTRGNAVILSGNRIAGNRLSPGAPNVSINSQSPFDTLNLDIQGNLVRGGTGGNLLLTTNGALQGTLACNAMVGSSQGLSVRTQTLQAPMPQLTIVNNLIDQHTPPIEPIYLEFGIGRGATSEVALDMRNNWWGEASGPYHPLANPQGRGDAVGANITFAPWLTAPPACLPPQ